VLSVPPADAKKIVQKTPGAAIIGNVVKGDGTVIIKSVFDKKTIIL
jgi:ABC-type thiamin/hydroxymethylpyrimidine transport system permease subunit